MKKNYITLSLLFSFYFSVIGAQTVTIPDPNFEQALIDLGIDSDGIINQSILYTDAQSVSSLNVSNRNISDLKGLGLFYNLTSLNCSNNKIINFPASYISSIKLTSLNISSNLITTLILKNEYGYRLSNIDVSNNPNLTFLELRLDSSRSADVINASQNPVLKTIICRNAKLRNININQCTALEELDLSGNSLTTIDVSTNVNIKKLDLSSNILTFFEIHNTQLNSLNVQGNPLKTLDCSNNKLTKVTLSYNENNLNLSNNNFTSLDLSGVPLTHLDLSQNISLTDLRLRDNPQLDLIDLSTNPNLQVLSLYKTPVTSLDVSNNIFLTSIDCIEGQLTNLDLSKNINLTSIHLRGNNITSLNLTQNPIVNFLYVSDNKLTSLDLRNGNNTLLTTFYADNNPDLSCIFVDNAIAANTGLAPYTNWQKDNSAMYRTVSCDYNIVLSVDKTTLLENGEQAIITATLNEVNSTEDVTINLVASGTAPITNYTLSSSTLIIPSGQLTATVTLMTHEIDMDSDKTVIIDVASVENADALTSQQLLFTIIHINSAPTDIVLSKMLVDENSIIGTDIGTFISTDVDSEDTYTYTLVSGDGDTDNSSFTITGNTLLSGKVFDFETKNSYSIRVQTDDGNGGIYSKPLTISINDLNFLYIEDSSASLRFKNDIILELECNENVKGFQFDITFPAGFVFNPLEIKNIGLPVNYQVSCSNISGNTFRVIGFSLTNELIVLGTTAIITFPTFINDGTPTGKYPIPVFNVTLSDVNNVDIATLSPKDGIVTVYRYPRGDTNGDSTVNILDILGAIDYIFGNPPSVFNFELADVNSDDTINILDILGIQDIILSPTTKHFAKKGHTIASKTLSGNNHLVVTSQTATTNEAATIAIALKNDDVVKGMQFDLVLPPGFTFNPAAITATSRLTGFNVSASEVSAQTYKVLIFSLSSATISAGTGSILNLPIFIESTVSTGVYPLTFSNVIISGINNTDIATPAPSIGEITISTLSNENFEVDGNDLTLYPNPATSRFYIKSDVLVDHVEIYDIHGSIILVTKYSENGIDVASLSHGMYFIKSYHNNTSKTFKFIKK